MSATLEAVNQILAQAGLPPVDSTETRNRQVSIVLDSLDRARKRLLRDNWRIFGRKTDLELDGEKTIVVEPYLRVVFPPLVRHRVNIEYGVVHDIERDASYDSPISGAFVVDDIPLEQISSFAWREYIALEAAVEFVRRLNDVDANYAQVVRQRDHARRRAINEKRTIIDSGFDVNRATRGFFE